MRLIIPLRTMSIPPPVRVRLYEIAAAAAIRKAALLNRILTLQANSASPLSRQFGYGGIALARVGGYSRLGFRPFIAARRASRRRFRIASASAAAITTVSTWMQNSLSALTARI